MTKNGMTEARKRANKKWDAANLSRMSVAMLISEYDEMQAHILAMGESRNGFINRAVRETIVNDRKKMGDAN